MNTNHRLTRYAAPSVNKVTVAFVLALMVALLTIMATGQRSQAQETNVITAGPAEVGFGAVQVGQDSQTRTITITNTGQTEAQFNLDILGLDGLPVSDFELINPPLGNILTLQPGGESTLEVRFSPTANGTQLAELNFGAVGGGDAPPSIVLEGTGTSTDPATQPGVQADCTIFGTPNSDRLTGTPGRDVICALGGNDRIDGRGDNDELRGEAGKDRIIDKTGTDKLFGGGGVDRLNAKDGSPGDLLKGGPKKDKVVKDKRDKGSRR